MARCVRDLAMLMQGMAAAEGHDTALPDWARGAASKPGDLVLGRLRGLFEELADPVMNAALERVIVRLREAGVTVKDVVPPAGFGEVLQRHRVVMAVEAAQFHEQRLRRHPDDYEPNIRDLLEEGLRVSAPEYARTKEHQRELSHAFRHYRSGLGAFLVPAALGPAPDAATTGDPAFNSPWSYTGLPVVSFPVERTPDGLPLSVQLVGFAWLEDWLFAAAMLCEKIVGFDVGEPPVS
jgi:aspartyl-tRNA(Asn)/glutamyl-tRNA(Gln) amidotransferase subunit A